MAEIDRKKEADFSMESVVSPESGPHAAQTSPQRERMEQKIIDMVTHAERMFSLGVRYATISQKLNRNATRLGIDLGTLLEDLDKKGLIFLYVDENYSRLVMAPEVREYYQTDMLGHETEATKNFINAKWGKVRRGAK